jgi:hypothetical protein
MFHSAQRVPWCAVMLVFMTPRTMRVPVLICSFVLACSYSAAGQDLSRYRDVVFGSSLSSVAAITGANATAVKVIHQRPALIQELTWRPQYSVTRPLDRSEAAQEVLFRFYDNELFSITVVYDPRLVLGLTDADMIDAVSVVYGPATRTAAASQGAAVAPPGMISGTTALARWQSPDYEFTLVREVYPATFRLIGLSRQLNTMARSAATEATRLDKEEAPRREAEQAAAEAARKRAADEKTRTTNKGEFRP